VLRSSPDCDVEETSSAGRSRNHCLRSNRKNWSRCLRPQPQTPAAGTAQYHRTACDVREIELEEVATAGRMARTALQQSPLQSARWDPED
jgi:hypothetical protein